MPLGPLLLMLVLLLPLLALRHSSIIADIHADCSLEENFHMGRGVGFSAGFASFAFFCHCSMRVQYKPVGCML